MLNNAFIYLFTGILNKAIPFLLLPVLTRYLTVEDYGTLSIFQVLLSFVIPIVGMNMQSNITRNYSKKTRDETALLIGNLMLVLLFAVLLVEVSLGVLLTLQGTFFGISSFWILLLPFVAGLSIVNQFNMTILRNQERATMFGMFQIVNTLINLTVSILLIVGLGFGWEGRGLGVFIAAFCLGFVSLIFIRRQKLVIFSVRQDLINEILRLSIPLIPHGVGGVVIGLSDRLFIDQMVNKEAVGLYAVGYTFGMVVNLCVDSFSQAWSPWFHKKMNNTDNNTKKRIVSFTYLYFVSILLIALIITYVSKIVFPFFIDLKFDAATGFIVWIAVGYAFRGMYTMMFPYLIFKANTRFIGFVTGFTAFINIILNYFLISINGEVGAAQATLIAWFSMFILTWIYAAKICPMPWFYFWRIKHE
jgi:O-antigen/teichoic acid export membrane protein